MDHHRPNFELSGVSLSIIPQNQVVYEPAYEQENAEGDFVDSVGGGHLQLLASEEEVLNKQGAGEADHAADVQKSKQKASQEAGVFYHF